MSAGKQTTRPGDHRADPIGSNAALPYSSGGIRATNFFRFRPQVSSNGEPDFRSGLQARQFFIDTRRTPWTFAMYSAHTCRVEKSN